MEDISRHKMQEGQRRMRTAESEVSAALIVKLATLVFEEIYSLHQSKAPSGTLKKNFKISKRKGGRQNHTVYNE